MSYDPRNLDFDTTNMNDMYYRVFSPNQIREMSYGHAMTLAYNSRISIVLQNIWNIHGGKSKFQEALCSNEDTPSWILHEIALKNRGELVHFIHQNRNLHGDTIRYMYDSVGPHYAQYCHNRTLLQKHENFPSSLIDEIVDMVIKQSNHVISDVPPDVVMHRNTSSETLFKIYQMNGDDLWRRANILRHPNCPPEIKFLQGLSQ